MSETFSRKLLGVLRSFNFPRFLLSNMETLSRNDGYDEWRKAEAKSIRSNMEKKIRILQNPKNCFTAKIIKCYPYSEPQGWGSTIHHIAECLTAAYLTNRTMIFDSRGFSYNPLGFSDVLVPFSKTCLHTGARETEIYFGSEWIWTNLRILD